MITIMYEELAALFLVARSRHDPAKFKLPVSLKEKGPLGILEMEQRMAEAREEALIAEAREEGRKEARKAKRKTKRKEARKRARIEGKL